MDALERVCNVTVTQVAQKIITYKTLTIQFDTDHDYVECNLGELAPPAEPQADGYAFMSEPGF